MKKIIFALVALCTFSIIATAQDSSGKVSLSIRFSPASNFKINFVGMSDLTVGSGDKFNADASMGSYTADIIGKYNLNKNLTARFGLGMASLKLKSYYKYTYANSESDLFEASLKQSRVIFMPALERNFKINKMGIYTGLGLPIGIIGKTTASETSTYSYTNPSSSDIYETNYELPGGFGIGLQSFAGFNFYITNGFAIGTEISYGLGYTNFGGRLIINEIDNGSSQAYIGDELKVHGLGMSPLNGALIMTLTF